VEGILASEIFYSLKDVQVLIKLRQHHYNTIKPHNSLDYMLLAPAAVLTLASHNLQVELSQTVVQL
jgi:hypothetical protein